VKQCCTNHNNKRV